MPGEWRKKGGMTEYFMFIGPYQSTLPRMPSRNNPDPTYDELLSREAFFNRCLSTKKQTDNYMLHPMLHDMNEIRFGGRLEDRKRAAKLYEKKKRGELEEQDLQELGEAMSSFPLVYSNFGSSFGSVRLYSHLRCDTMAEVRLSDGRGGR
jgi:hypothetical protein